MVAAQEKTELFTLFSIERFGPGLIVWLGADRKPFVSIDCATAHPGAFDHGAQRQTNVRADRVAVKELFYRDRDGSVEINQCDIGIESFGEPTFVTTDPEAFRDPG